VLAAAGDNDEIIVDGLNGHHQATLTPSAAPQQTIV
jgi:hypothetical protein